MKKIVLLVIGILLIGGVSIKASELIESSQVIYKDNNTVAIALDELFSAVDINERLGNNDISGIGDGTVTGAIDSINTNLNQLFSNTVRKDPVTTTISSSTNGVEVDSITVEKDGLIYVKGMATFDGYAKGKDIAVGLYLNNDAVLDRYQIAAPTVFTPAVTVSSLLNVKKGDVIKVYVAQYSGYDVQVSSVMSYLY